MSQKMRDFAYALVLGATFVACGVEPTVTCSDDSACFEGYRCDSETSTCLRSCEADASSDCLSGQVCDVPTGETAGVCRQSVGAQNSGNSDSNSNNSDDTGG